MSKQNATLSRTSQQNLILDLEKKYMAILDDIITSERFISDLRNIEEDTQEYYGLLEDVWGKKNKIKEASERLVRHHLYTNFLGTSYFYPFPISCDIAIETEDCILNVDVKTIDKVGNKGELNTTQLEHNQTSFINKTVCVTRNFPGFKVRSNLQAMDPRTKKPILTYLIKIGYADDGNGRFNMLNDEKLPSLVLTCIPNGILSSLFDHDLFVSFKDYVYYDGHDDVYYKPRKITSKDEFSKLDQKSKFTRIEGKTDIPKSWERIFYEDNGKVKVGYHDEEKDIVWLAISKKVANHWDYYLYAVKCGNTVRFNDEWLTDRYDSKNESWLGEIKHYKIYR